MRQQRHRWATLPTCPKAQHVCGSARCCATVIVVIGTGTVSAIGNVNVSGNGIVTVTVSETEIGTWAHRWAHLVVSIAISVFCRVLSGTGTGSPATESATTVHRASMIATCGTITTIEAVVWTMIVSHYLPDRLPPVLPRAVFLRLITVPITPVLQAPTLRHHHHRHRHCEAVFLRVAVPSAAVAELHGLDGHARAVEEVGAVLGVRRPLLCCTTIITFVVVPLAFL